VSVASPARFERPRVRSWVVAAVGVAVPPLLLALAFAAHALRLEGAAGMLFVAGILCAGPGAIATLMAFAYGFAALLRLDAPRPMWRFVEPWALMVPFAAMMALLGAAGSARLY